MTKKAPGRKGKMAKRRTFAPASLAHRGERAPLAHRLKQIKLLLCDVDGVLTEGTVFIGGASEVKQFNIRDGLGLLLLQKNGIKIGWISNRPSTVTLQRAQELKIDFLCQEKTSKVETAEKILRQTGLNWRE